MKSINEIKTALENRSDRSAWDRGVNEYALEILGEVERYNNAPSTRI